MSETLRKKYGPSEWPKTVLEQVRTVISENDDEPVTEQVVEGWKRNFERHVKGFGEGHKSLIKKD